MRFLFSVIRTCIRAFVLFIVLSPLWSGISEAWLPPEVSIEKAFEKGNIAFTGRVVGIKEVDYDKWYSGAVADVKILKTYFGTGLRPGDLANVEYYGHAYFDYPNPCFGIDLNISDHVLLVFVGNSMEDGNTYRFTSCYGKYAKEMDYAYVYKDDPGDDINDAELTLSLLSGWWTGAVKKADLEKWAAAEGKGDSVPGKGQRVFRYEHQSIDLLGVMTERTFYGPPGYGENPEEDSKEHAYILRLTEPIDALAKEGDELFETHRNVSEVQIVNLKKLELDHYGNNTVTVTGKLFSPIRDTIIQRY